MPQRFLELEILGKRIMSVSPLTLEEVEPYGQAVFAISIVGAIPTLSAGSVAAAVASIAGTIFLGYLLLTTAYVWSYSKSREFKSRLWIALTAFAVFPTISLGVKAFFSDKEFWKKAFCYGCYWRG